MVAKKFNAQPEQLCLIFAGKIMKDPETLGTHKVKDGLTVHLVIKSKTQSGSDSAATTPTSAPQQPSTRPGQCQPLSYYMSIEPQVWLVGYIIKSFSNWKALHSLALCLRQQSKFYILIQTVPRCHACERYGSNTHVGLAWYFVIFHINKRLFI